MRPLNYKVFSAHRFFRHAGIDVTSKCSTAIQSASVASTINRRTTKRRTPNYNTTIQSTSKCSTTIQSASVASTINRRAPNCSIPNCSTSISSIEN